MRANLATYPFQCIVTVVDPRWPRKFGREPIVNVHNDDAVLLARKPTFGLIGVEIA